uniref:Uncharacterized protein MANES_04G140700 n=1 Tax=Rhizophora mucronata TaxID=61149 RepID=A0A2P2JNG0_RHIMU
MASTKTLIRAGASLMNRMVLSKPNFYRNTYSNTQIVSQNFEITPQIFPSFSKMETFLHFPQNNADSTKTAASNLGFLPPCGLPSLRFFLPDGTLCVTLCVCGCGWKQ